MIESENKNVVNIENLKIKIKKSNKLINYGSFSINAGDFVMIEGHNGCGKSTFLKLLKNEAGDRCTLLDGNIYIDGECITSSRCDVEKLRRSIVDIDQADLFLKNESTFHALIRPAITASCDDLNKKEKKTEIINLAFEYYKEFIYRYFHADYNENGRNVERHRENPKTDLNFMYFKPVSSLSGGQQKMIHILQGVIKLKTSNSRLLLMDEPLNNLDKENKKILINLINDLRKDMNIAILLITHCRLFPGINNILKFDKENNAKLLSIDNLKPFDCLKDE